MDESAYDKIHSRIGIFMELYMYLIKPTSSIKIDIMEKYGPDVVDPFMAMFDIDQFKKENPNEHIKYLEQILLEYLSLNRLLGSGLNTKRINLIDAEEAADYAMVMDCTIKAIEHLEGILNSESETHKQPKPTAAPKGKTQLNRNQTGLLFWYLRERSLIAPKAENQNLGKAIEIMTGHSAGIMADILKKPQTDVCKLGKGELVNMNDFDIVIAELEKLIIRIKTDRRKNVENGELN